jgi:hypothetical protein
VLSTMMTIYFKCEFHQPERWSLIMQLYLGLFSRSLALCFSLECVVRTLPPSQFAILTSSLFFLSNMARILLSSHYSAPSFGTMRSSYFTV